MSMPRSEARSRSIATESCGCVGVADQARLLEARVLLHLGDDLVGRVAELLVVVADQRELQAVAGAANAEAVRLDRE